MEFEGTSLNGDHGARLGPELSPRNLERPEVDFFTSESKKVSETQVFASDSELRRAKSSLRLKYEAEVRVIQRKLGSLEEIREKLNLSQRKMSQLLLVDPSAWTRWTKTDDEAPPHIYRMLQWYLALEEKYPTLDVNFWLSTVARVNTEAGNVDRDQKIQSLSLRLQSVTAELEQLKTQQQIQAAVDRVRQGAQAENKSQLETLNSTKSPAVRFWLWFALFAMGLIVGYALASR